MPSDHQFDSAEIWLSALRSAGRSPKTTETYAAAIAKLRAWRQTDEDLSTLSKLEARAFVRSLLDRYTPGGVMVRIRSLRAFYGWLIAEDMIEVNPFTGIRVSVPDEEQATVTDAQLDRMLASAKRSRRDTAIITLFADTGARRRELANVVVGDVDLRSGTITFRVSKTRPRTVPLSDRAVLAVRRWLQHRPLAGRKKGSMSNLWLSANPHELMIAVTRRHSGGIVTPHQLRRRFAVEWLRRGGSESSLMRLCGWSSTAMIRTYIRAGADQIAAEEFRRLLG